MVSAITGILVGVLVLIALAVAMLRDVLAAAIVFGAYSLGMAVLWVVFQAPDVALTEAAVGAGVMTALLLTTIVRIGRPAGDAVFLRDISPISVLVAVGAAVALLVTVPHLPAVGSVDTPAFGGPAAYYIDRSVAVYGVDNVVTAVLAGFRGFDTVAEVVVILGAGLAVAAINRSGER